MRPSAAWQLMMTDLVCVLLAFMIVLYGLGAGGDPPPGGSDRPTQPGEAGLAAAALAPPDAPDAGALSALLATRLPAGTSITTEGPALRIALPADAAQAAELLATARPLLRAAGAPVTIVARATPAESESALARAASLAAPGEGVAARFTPNEADLWLEAEGP